MADQSRCVKVTNPETQTKTSNSPKPIAGSVNRTFPPNPHIKPTTNTPNGKAQGRYAALGITESKKMPPMGSKTEGMFKRRFTESTILPLSRGPGGCPKAIKKPKNIPLAPFEGEKT